LDKLSVVTGIQKLQQFIALVLSLLIFLGFLKLHHYLQTRQIIKLHIPQVRIILIPAGTTSNCCPGTTITQKVSTKWYRNCSHLFPRDNTPFTTFLLLTTKELVNKTNNI
jgi:hypothetical protein